MIHVLKIDKKTQEETEYDIQDMEKFPWCLDQLMEHVSEYFENIKIEVDLYSSGTQGCGANVFMETEEFNYEFRD